MLFTCGYPGIEGRFSDLNRIYADRGIALSMFGILLSFDAALAAHIGEQTQYHSPEERFFFRPAYIAELQALAVPAITRPARYAAVIAQGDELLSWREMTGRYPGAQIRLLPGSDHALSDFDDHLPFVLNFLNLLTPCD